MRCLRQLHQNLLLHLLNSLWLQFVRSARDQSNRWIITFTASPAWAYAEAALDESDCGHCADQPARVLRALLAAGAPSCRATEPNGLPIPRFPFPRTVSAPLLTLRSSYPLATRRGMTPCPSRPRRRRIGRDRSPII